jgi:hypothetical protein
MVNKIDFVRFPDRTNPGTRIALEYGLPNPAAASL